MYAIAFWTPAYKRLENKRLSTSLALRLQPSVRNELVFDRTSMCMIDELYKFLAFSVGACPTSAA